MVMNGLQRLDKEVHFVIPDECDETKTAHLCEHNIENYCTWLEGDMQAFQLTGKFAGSYIVDCLTLASGTVGFFFCIVIWLNKELQVHPMKLVMFCILADSMLAYHIVATHFICKGGFGELFA